MIHTIRVFGVAVLSIETDETKPAIDKGDVTTAPQQAGFVRDDLPNWHRPEGDNE